MSFVVNVIPNSATRGVWWLHKGMHGGTPNVSNVIKNFKLREWWTHTWCVYMKLYDILLKTFMYSWKVKVPQIWKNLAQVGVNSVLKALIEGKGFEFLKRYHTQIQKNLPQVWTLWWKLWYKKQVLKYEKLLHADPKEEISRKGKFQGF